MHNLNLPPPARRAMMTAMDPAHATRPGAAGFTLIELLVVIAIVAILAAMLLPTVGMVQDAARSARCQSNLRQIAMAFDAYAQDWDQYPDYQATDGSYWQTRLEPYVEADGATASAAAAKAALTSASGVLRSCPAWKNSAQYAVALADASARTIGYGMTSRPWRDKAAWFNLGSNQNAPANYKIITPSNVTYRSQRILVGDSGYRFVDSDTMPISAWDDRQRHRGRANAAMFDGHVESLAPATFLLAISDPSTRP